MKTNFEKLNTGALSSIFGGNGTGTTGTDSQGNTFCDVKDDDGCIDIVECK